MRVAVAGGTGVVGCHVVQRLHDEGHTAVVLARRHGVDLTSGSGLEAALDGADALVDVVNVATMRRSDAIDFFSQVARNLVSGAERSGGHLVSLSIVGIDAMPTGYYAGKLAQERVLLDGGGPVTVLRATQFHEFAGQVLARTPGPVAVVPRMRVQPIAAREVAGSLVELASGPPLGRAPDLAGPAEEQMVEMARRLLRARGSRRVVVPVRLPGPGGKAAASGSALPVGIGPRGAQTFDEWLAGDDARPGCDGADRPRSRRGAGHRRLASAHRPEEGPDLLGEEGRLLEGGEVAASGRLAPVADVGELPGRPVSR